MKTRFVIFVVMFGLMGGSVLAQRVTFAFTADIISGPEAGGIIVGEFFYDPDEVSNAADFSGSGDAIFGDFTGRQYSFNPGGLGVSFTGDLTDSLADVPNVGIRLTEGTIRDGLRITIATVTNSPAFVVGWNTVDLTLINGLDLPTNLFVPSDTSQDASLYIDGSGNPSNLQITSLGLAPDCEGGNDLQTAINDLRPNGGTIVVNDACGVKVSGSFVPFTISGFTGRLTIDLTSGSLSQPVIGCGTDISFVFPRPSAVLRIEDSSDVRLISSTPASPGITGGLGVVVVDSDVTFEGGVQVTLSRREGVRVLGSTGRVRLRGDDNRIGDSCSHGIIVRSKLSAFVSGTTMIDNNGRFGMFGVDGATLVASQNAVISSNGWGGIHGRLGTTVVASGGIKTDGNGTDTSTRNLLVPRFRSNLSVYSGSNLSVVANASGVPEIFNALGPGIIVSLGSIAQLRGVNVHSNSVGFVALLNSTVEFSSENGPNILQGNNKDIACDKTSVVVGDFVANVKNCATTGGQ